MSAPRPVLPSELFAGPESWWAQQQPAGVQRPMPEWLSVILGNPKEGVAAQHESQPMWATNEFTALYFCLDSFSECLPGDRILWMFTTNGELQFEMVCRPRESNQEEPVWPRNSGSQPTKVSNKKHFLLISLLLVGARARQRGMPSSGSFLGSVYGVGHRWLADQPGHQSQLFCASNGEGRN
jgi:hypothetical protein